MTKKKSKQTPNYFLYPLYFMVAILPLVMRAKRYDTHLATEPWYSSQAIAIDFFLYYKQWLFVILSAIIAIILLFHYKKLHTLSKEYKLFLPLGIYGVLCIVSTLQSKYRSWGITGSYEQFENVFCLLGYTLVIFYTYLLVKEKGQLHQLVTALGIGALFIGCIGTLQTLGANILDSAFFRQILCHNALNPDSIRSSFEKGTAYATLYNPNYVGVYTAMILSFFMILLVYEQKKSRILFDILIIITNAITLLGSGSKAGLLSVLLSLIIAAIFMRKRLLNRWKITLPLLLLSPIALIGFNILNHNAYLLKIKQAFQIKKQAPADISKVTSYDDHIEMTFKGNQLKVSLTEPRTLLLTDSNNTPIPYIITQENENQLVLAIDDIRFHDLIPIIYLNDIASFSLVYHNKYWTFSTKAIPGTYSFYNRFQKFSPIKDAKTLLFTDYPSFASRRGFIWARTLPLLKEHILLGSGADSFIHVFPQYDYAGMYAIDYQSFMITKPHNIYLQIGVQTGVLSLIALFLFLIQYLLKSVGIYFRNSYTDTSAVIGLAAFTATISFLITGLTNDSCIVTTPVFVVILSLGLTANRFSNDKK